ncbi:transposase [Psychrobacillus sp.]|uniref:transposase n=1 Tax=Psychrobacillus sp. TaxID=1871623 RepID=UPI0028BD319B|nr:transposase [Psychrobacillus sp.]
MLAFCFMTNHYHILIKSNEAPLSKIMSLINKRYSTSNAKRYNHIGLIYQKRFFCKKSQLFTWITKRQYLYSS